MISSNHPATYYLSMTIRHKTKDFSAIYEKGKHAASDIIIISVIFSFFQAFVQCNSLSEMHDCTKYAAKATHSIDHRNGHMASLLT